MAETPSKMIALGTQIPPFSLPACTHELWSRDEKQRGILVIFMCNHCPFVVHIAEILPTIHKYCQNAGIEFVGINSNDVQNYPDDHPEKMVDTAKLYGWTFPYLYDEDQSVAKAFNATCTPDAFLYSDTGHLFYRGQLDDSRPNSGVSATGKDLLNAIHLLNSGASPPAQQLPSIGCNIKWKP